MNLIVLSCAGGDDDDDDSSGSPCASVATEEDACDLISGGFPDDQQCLTNREWSFESPLECREEIKTLLDSDDSCDQVVGECLNTMYKYGAAEVEGEPGQVDCRLLEPLSCEEAWTEWNNCLALADSGDC